MSQYTYFSNYLFEVAQYGKSKIQNKRQSSFLRLSPPHLECVF